MTYHSVHILRQYHHDIIVICGHCAAGGVGGLVIACSAVGTLCEIGIRFPEYFFLGSEMQDLDNFIDALEAPSRNADIHALSPKCAKSQQLHYELIGNLGLRIKRLIGILSDDRQVDYRQILPTNHTLSSLSFIDC